MKKEMIWSWLCFCWVNLHVLYKFFTSGLKTIFRKSPSTLLKIWIQKFCIKGCENYGGKRDAGGQKKLYLPILALKTELHLKANYTISWLGDATTFLISVSSFVLFLWQHQKCSADV